MGNWSKLKADEKVRVIKFARLNGVSDIKTIRDTFNMYADGGDLGAYNTFVETLPDNMKHTDTAKYDMYRYWELNGRPKDFEEAKKREMFHKELDGYYHASTLAEVTNSPDKHYGTLEFIKAKNHNTIGLEIGAYLKDKNHPMRNKEYILDYTGDKARYRPRTYSESILPEGAYVGNIPITALYANGGNLAHKKSGKELGETSWLNNGYNSSEDWLLLMRMKTNQMLQNLLNSPFYMTDLEMLNLEFTRMQEAMNNNPSSEFITYTGFDNNGNEITKRLPATKGLNTMMDAGVVDYMPTLGDAKLAVEAVVAAKQGDYLTAGLLGGMMFVPNFIEKPLKKMELLGIPKYLRNRFFKNSDVTTAWRGTPKAYTPSEHSTGMYGVTFLSPSKDIASAYGIPHLYAFPDNLKLLDIDFGEKAFNNIGTHSLIKPTPELENAFNIAKQNEFSKLKKYFNERYYTTLDDKDIELLSKALHSKDWSPLYNAKNDMLKYFYNRRQGLDPYVMILNGFDRSNLILDDLYLNGQMLTKFAPFTHPELPGGEFNSIDEIGRYIESHPEFQYDGIRANNVVDFGKDYTEPLTLLMLKKTIPIVFIKENGGYLKSTGGPLYPFSFEKNPFLKTPVVRYDEGGQTYTVKKGDTFSLIALNVGVSVLDLQKLNPTITNVNRIREGLNINIPTYMFSEIFNTPQSIGLSIPQVLRTQPLHQQNTPILSVVVPTQKGLKTAGPLDLQELAVRQAYTESRLRPDIVNDKGAYGLFQIMLPALDDYNRVNKTNYTLEDMKNADNNIKVRNWYMDYLSNLGFINKGDIQSDSIGMYKVLASFNAGAGNVKDALTRAKADGKDIYDSWDWVSYLWDEPREYADFILRGIETKGTNKNDSVYKAVSTAKSGTANKIRSSIKL